MKNKFSKKILGEFLFRIGDYCVFGVCFFYIDIFYGIFFIVKYYV